VITLVEEDQIRVQGHATLAPLVEESANVADELIFKLTEQTETTVSGEPADKEALLQGMEVTVIAERHDKEAVAKRIDAKPVRAS
jgi:hypothetical protein